MIDDMCSQCIDRVYGARRRLLAVSDFNYILNSLLWAIVQKEADNYLKLWHWIKYVVNTLTTIF